MKEERDDHETVAEHRERLLAEEFRKLLEGTGITREDIAAAVPLRHEGIGGADGVDGETTYRQIAELLQASRKAQLNRLITEANIIARTRGELLKALSQPPKGLPQTQQFRLIVDVALRLIAAGSDHFEHTTHGIGASGGLPNVATSVVEAYANPTSYNLSTLSQVINLFLKGQ